jgi:hypothetical protein
MTRFGRLLCVWALAAGISAMVASAATATTFYVDERGESHTCLGAKHEEACATIDEAIKLAEASPGANTIEVAAGAEPYKEPIDLKNAHDDGLTINGEEPGVEITVHGVSPVVTTAAAAGTVALSNLTVKNEVEPRPVIENNGAELTLDNVVVDNDSTSGKDGIEVNDHGSLAMNGGSVSMENGASGFAVDGIEGAITLDGVTILNGSESQAEAGGVNSEKSTLVMTKTNVAVETGLSPVLFGVAAGNDTSVSLNTVTVRQNTSGTGVVLEKSPTTVDGLRVEMLNASSIAAGVLDESETPGLSSALSDLEVSGIWKGVGLLADGEQVTLSDSRVTQGSSSVQPALRYAGGEGGTGLVVQRSVLQAPPTAKPGVVEIGDSNATLDSSEVLGGAAGVESESSLGGVRTLTVDGSTIAPNNGVSFEAPGVVGVEANAHGANSSTVQVAIEGSILPESQVATTANGGNAATVTCSYSAVPSQIQTASTIAGRGEIACASGTTGNTNASAELTTLFAEPLHNYNLSPASSAVDSVPASAISLPFGLTPSTTDLAGNPRVVDGNGDCIAVQDKGALELQGHSAPCPTATGSTIATTPITTFKSLPLLLTPLGVISDLKISPSSFFVRHSLGEKLVVRGKHRKYGAMISYRDSQAARTTFTVLRKAMGRFQHRSCKRRSKFNSRGKACKLILEEGSFSRTDLAGINSLYFNGRLKGNALPSGTYILQAVPQDGAGKGAMVSSSFTIRG